MNIRVLLFSENSFYPLRLFKQNYLYNRKKIDVSAYLDSTYLYLSTNKASTLQTSTLKLTAIFQGLQCKSEMNFLFDFMFSIILPLSQIKITPFAIKTSNQANYTSCLPMRYKIFIHSLLIKSKIGECLKIEIITQTQGLYKLQD